MSQDLFSGMGDISSLFDEIDETNSANPYYKKALEAVTTANEKAALLRGRTVEKQVELEGFKILKNASFSDPDSGLGTDSSTGQQFGFRLVGSPDKRDYLDALDLSTSNKSYQSKQIQADFLSKQLGKPVSELMDTDYQNYYNYQQQEFNKQFTGEEEFLFDKNKIYEPAKPMTMDLYYKEVGVDEHGRKLIEVVNPKTNRNVGFDVYSNPLLNTRNSSVGFNVSKVLNTESNRKRYNDHVIDSNVQIKKVLDAIDADSRVGEFFDQIQSSAYRSASRLLQYGPDWLVDKEHWKSVANERTGQQLADAWAGVKDSTRQDFVSNMQKASDLFDKGDYTGAIITWATQLDRLFAESATQMALITAGTLATGGLGGGLKGASYLAARAGAMFLGAMPAGLDVTLSMNEQYKANNNGKDMSGEELIQHFFVNTALLVPDAFLVGVNFKGLLPSKVSDLLQFKKLPSKLKTILTSAAGEFVQEAAQESYETYGSQSKYDPNRQSYFGILFSEEGAKAGTIGALMGGALSGASTGLSTAVNLKTDIKNRKILEANRKRFIDETPTGEKADITISRANIEAIENISGDIDGLSKIDEALGIPDLNNEAVVTLQRKKSEILMKLAKEGKLPSNISIDQVFEQYAQSADPIGDWEFDKVKSKEEINESFSELEKKGEDLGLSKEQVKKTLGEVSHDVRYGPKGYFTYEKNINDLETQLSDPNTSEESKPSIKKQIQNNLDSLVRLYNNQVHKLNVSDRTIANLTSTPKPSLVARFLSGKPFEFKSADLVRSSFKYGIGPYGLLNAVKANIIEMGNILNKYSDQLEKKVNILDKKAIDSIHENIETNIQKLREAETVEISKKPIIQKIKEKIIGETKKADPDKPLDNLKGHIRIAEGLNNAKNNGYNVDERIGRFLDKFTKEHLIQLQDYLKNNPNESASQLIDNAIATREESEVTVERELFKAEKTIEQAEEGKSKFTKEAVESIETKKDFIEFSDKFSEMYRELKKLSNVDSKNIKAKELLEYYDKLDLLNITTSKIETILQEDLNLQLGDVVTKDIAGESITYTVVTRESLKGAPARYTKNGIQVAEDLNKKDLNIIKSLVEKFKEVDLDYNELIKDLKKEQILDFILLHELRHHQQELKEDSKESYMEKYNKTPGRYEFEALLYPLVKMELIDTETFKNVYTKVLLPLSKKTETKKVFPTSDTGFTPKNQEQADTISAIQSFLKDKSPEHDIFVVEGKAGTGKTTIMQEAIVDYLRNGGTVTVSALSHKAKTVLTSKIESFILKNNLSGNVEGYSTAALLSKKQVIDEETGNVTFESISNTDSDSPIEVASLLIIDEASMIDQQIYDEIMERKGYGVKVIFLGDTGQLAPINGVGVSPIFSDKKLPRIRLTERVRQGEDSALLPYADYYWNNAHSDNAKSNPIPQEVRESKKGIRFYSDINEVLKTYMNKFKEAVKTGNSSLIKIIAYNNKLGNSKNASMLRNLETSIREFIFGKDPKPFEKGELIIFGNNFNVSKNIIITNSQEFQIKDVTEPIKTDVYTRNRNDSISLNSYRLTLELDDDSNVSVLVLDPKEMNKWKKFLDNYASYIKKSGQRNLWVDFYSLKDKVFAPVEYSYVITSHKAQGSTYNTSIVLEDNFFTNSRVDNAEISRGLYTAITRASEEAIIVSNKNKDISSEVKESSSTKLNNTVKNTDEFNSNAFTEDNINTIIEEVEEIEDQDPITKEQVKFTKDLIELSNINLKDSNDNTKSILNFKLSNEVRATKPQSNILIKGVRFDDSRLSNKIKESLNTFKDLIPNLLKDTKGKKVNNQIAYFIKGMWEANPALRLLMDFKQKGNNLNFKLREEIGVILDFSLREFLSTISLGEVFNPYTKDQINTVFDIDFNKFKDAEAFNKASDEARELFNQYGIPRTYLTNKLGELILDNLGIKPNKKGSVNFYNRLAEDLGVFALRYATENGWITQNKLENPKKTYSFLKAEKSIPFLKLTSENRNVIDDIVKDYKDNLKKKFKLENNDSTGPRETSGTVSKRMTIKNTNGLSIVPGFVRGVMNKIFKTKWELNEVAVDYVLDIKNKVTIMKQLGFKNDKEMEALSWTDRQSQLGINQQVKREYDSLFDLSKELKSSERRFSFFNYFMSKNGRFNLDSTTVNPQGSKFHRFLMMPSNMKQKFIIGNEAQLRFTYYAIAQAFDSLSNETNHTKLGEALINMSSEELATMKDKLVNLSKKEFVAEYGKYGIKGIENFTHALSVIQHLEAYAHNRDVGNISFDSFLAIENDSTTSGYFIRQLQMPNAKSIWNEKVGILIDKDTNNGLLTIHEMKKTGGFNDIYKTMAEFTARKLPKKGDNLAPYFKDSKYNKETLKNIFELMQSGLPKPEEDGSIGSALRSLLKDPTMIFGYTAGEKSIKKALSEKIYTEFIRNFLIATDKKGENLTTEEQSALDTFNYLSTMYRGGDYFIDGKKVHIDNLYTALKSVSETEITLNGVALSTLFHEVLAPTYGDAVWQSLKSSFGESMKYSEKMNRMTNTMFKYFNIELEKRMDVLREKYGEYHIPIKEEQEVLKGLFDLIPAMKLLYNTFRDGIHESALLTDTEKEIDLKSKIQSYYMNSSGTLTSDTSYANVRKFTDAGQAGAVLPIHFIDGMMMSLLLDRFGDKVLGVHDAVVMSALDNTEITQFYNEMGYLINKEFDMFGTMVNGFLDSLESYEKLTGKDVSSEFIDDGSMPISDFKDELIKLRDENTEARRKFYGYGTEAGQVMFITNMDGIGGSGFNVTGHETLAEHQFYSIIRDKKNKVSKLIRKELEKVGSDPESFVPGPKIRDWQRGSLLNKNIADEIFDSLQKLDIKGEHTEHLEYLKTLVANINPEAVKDLSVELFEGNFNTGQISADNIIRIGLDQGTADILDRNTRLSPLTHKSAAEVFAHEQIHAVLSFGLSVLRDKPQYSKKIKEALNLQHEAMKHLKVEHFRPSESVYNAANSQVQAIYDKNARAIYNYIFNQQGEKARTNLNALKEFLTYSMTNETVRNVLKDVFIEHKTKEVKDINGNYITKYKLLDRVISFGIAVMNLVSGKESFGKTFQSFKEIFKGTKNLREKEYLLGSIEKFYNDLNSSNEKAINRLIDHPLRAMEYLFGYFGELIKRGNYYFSKSVKKIGNFVDEKGWTYFNVPKIHGSLFDSAKLVSNLILLYPFSKSRRAALPTILSKMNIMSQQSSLATIIRDAMEPSTSTARLEVHAANTRQVEKASKGLEHVVAQNIRSYFKVEPSDTELAAMTNTLLKADLSSLMIFNEKTGKYNVKEMMDILRDHVDKKSKNETSILEKNIAELESKLDNNEHRTYYLTQAEALGKFMAKEEGNEALNLNARNIANKLGTGTLVEASEDVVNTIDKLASYYALIYTNTDDLAHVANLDTNGINNFIKVHETFKKESREARIVDPIHEVKGYTKKIFDNSIHVLVGKVSDAKKMSDLGYKPIKKLASGYTGETDLVMYKRTWNSSKRIDSGAYMLQGQNTIGTLLLDSAYRIVSEIDSSTPMDAYRLHQVLMEEAGSISSELINKMSKKRMTMEEIEKISKKYTPVASPNGGYSDYRVVMSSEDKIKHLGMNTNAIAIMSRMYASNHNKINAPIRNKIITGFLERDMLDNMLSHSKMSAEGKDFVKLEKDSDNKFVRKMWNAIPKELKEVIAKYDKSGEGFYVRNEWLVQILGAPSISAVDNKYIAAYTTAWMKKAITVGEYILKHITYIAKNNIVVKMPSVLIGNIMSNFWYAVSSGHNPAKVLSRTLRNAGHIKDYIVDKKQLEIIQFKQRLGTATQLEQDSINLIKTKLEHNPLHPLMEKGMYQSIVEDLSPNDVDGVAKINKEISLKTKNLPGPLKNTLKQLFMTEGTPLYEFMFQTTQYSDFVARATYYQLELEKVSSPILKFSGKPNPDYVQKYKLDKNGKPLLDSERNKILTKEYIEYEEKLTHATWNAFINYDKPQGAGLQYLNDLGFVMFTKWATRITHVLFKGFSDNPVSTLLFLMAQSQITNVYPFDSNIYQNTPWNRNYGNLIFSPLDNAAMALMPMPARILFDM